MSALRLDILTEGPREVASVYMLEGMIAFWRARGIEVAARPIGAPGGDADIAIAHVDRTRVDEAALARERASAPVINGSVADISKRRISCLLVTSTDDYHGPVIVKTDLNFNGAPETCDDAGWAARKIAELRRRLPARLVRDITRYGYPIFDRKADVPRWVWGDVRYVIERYAPERDGDLYVLRSWAFFGDRDYVCKIRAPSPIVKAPNAVDHAVLDAPPAELVAIRKNLNFDLGKFDYVEIDGAPILLDANKTPSMLGRTPRHMELLEYLAGGIDAYVNQAAQSQFVRQCEAAP